MVSIGSSKSKQRTALSLLTTIRTGLGIVGVVLLLWFSFASEDDDIPISAVLAQVGNNDNAAAAAIDGPPPVMQRQQVKVQEMSIDLSPLRVETELEEMPKETPQQITETIQQQTASQHTTSGSTTITTKPKATIAYAWTLAKCKDFQSSTEGMVDAALILKHSVHQVSSRVGKSQYDYQMYVLVHPDAAACTNSLEDAGYTVKVLPSPVNKDDIEGDFLRANVDKEWCCGSKEFIKLYSYTLFEHPIVVHVDIDFAFFQPMDELFDAMLEGTRKDEIHTQWGVDKYPENIEAFITRDYQQVIPGDKLPLFQAGFMVVKPNQEVFDELVKVILKGDFKEGFSTKSGWGGMGYAAKVGSKAMQGLIAYYYDVLRPGVSVELHGCRYNWMGGDVFYRGVPSFNPRQYPEKVGKCRNGAEECEDCQKTDFSEIGSVHYTNCRKPWNCIGIKWEQGQSKTAQGIDERNTQFDKCMEIVGKWHELRTQMEDKVIALTGNQTLATMWRAGDFHKDLFRGHCLENGQSGYIPLSRGVSSKLFEDIYK